jgi:hypothetical protein
MQVIDLVTFIQIIHVMIKKTPVDGHTQIPGYYRGGVEVSIPCVPVAIVIKTHTDSWI